MTQAAPASAVMEVDLKADDYADFVAYMYKRPEMRGRRMRSHLRFAVLMVVVALLAYTAWSAWGPGGPTGARSCPPISRGWRWAWAFLVAGAGLRIRAARPGEGQYAAHAATSAR